VRRFERTLFSCSNSCARAKLSSLTSAGTGISIHSSRGRSWLLCSGHCHTARTQRTDNARSCSARVAARVLPKQASPRYALCGPAVCAPRRICVGRANYGPHRFARRRRRTNVAKKGVSPGAKNGMGIIALRAPHEARMLGDGWPNCKRIRECQLLGSDYVYIREEEVFSQKRADAHMNGIRL
jgi:hypothetical protein